MVIPIGHRDRRDPSLPWPSLGACDPASKTSDHRQSLRTDHLHYGVRIIYRRRDWSVRASSPLVRHRVQSRPGSATPMPDCAHPPMPL